MVITTKFILTKFKILNTHNLVFTLEKSTKSLFLKSSNKSRNPKKNICFKNGQTNAVCGSL